jgi:hypothetical protein
MMLILVRKATLALLLGAGWANAAAITYTESATASGSLGGAAFNGSLITLTLVGDTSNVTMLGTGFFVNAVGTIAIQIASLGATANLTDPSRVFVNQGAVAAGFGDNTGDSILDTFGSVFGSYGLTTAIGPITNNNFINSGLGFATDHGSFVINSAGNSTFTASLGSASAPEPGTVLLFGISVLGVVGMLAVRAAWQKLQPMSAFFTRWHSMQPPIVRSVSRVS